jgi:acetyl-CoA carboxylase carboxyl transferase subunit alpha
VIAPLDFEKDINTLEVELEQLRRNPIARGTKVAEEIAEREKKLVTLLTKTYKKLTPWQKVQVARHPHRPHVSEFITGLIDDFQEIAGDRLYAEDRAIVAGIGRFEGRSVFIMGQEKGHDVETRLRHNFGMPKPEGYRKAQRVMQLADHFGLPLITLIDTAGAHPGLEAEERGQAEAIARSIDTLLTLRVPVISIVTGEGGSGGAIALGVGNQVMMLEHAIYSVVSPEGCASILWRTADKKEDAAAAQKFTAQDLMAFKVIDHIIEEPLGGAHRNPQQAIASVSKTVSKSLESLSGFSGDELRRLRHEKFLAMGRTL